MDEELKKQLQEEPFRSWLFKPCRNCGELVDFRDYCDNKICIHCGQPTAPKNIKEVHIVFCETMKSSISHLVKQTKNELFEFGIDYKVLLFTHLMEMGDIRNVPYSNEQECAMYSLSSEDSQKYINQTTFDLSCIDKTVEVFLWVNLCDADAYLSFLYFSSLFCNFSTVYFVPCYSWENIQDKNYTPTLSLQQKVKLTKNDFEKISGEFEKIKVQDGFFRIALDGKIYTFNKDDFDNEVLSCVSSKFERDNKIVSRFYKKNKTTFKRLLSLPQLWEVLNGLIEKGFVETKFDNVGLWENEIRLKK